MTKIRFDRLKKLADHLMHGKLGHKKFDFSNYNVFPEDTIKKNKCGTAGCALGECPIIFKEWKFTGSGSPCIPGCNHDPEISAESFFGIAYLATYHLFHSGNQNVEKFGGKSLRWKATRKQVAKNIYAFIEKMQEGK